jgi:hypothetical protein
VTHHAIKTYILIVMQKAGHARRISLISPFITITALRIGCRQAKDILITVISETG